MEVTLNIAKVSNVGQILTWNAQVNYPNNLIGSQNDFYIWFSPIGWLDAKFDPSG